MPYGKPTAPLYHLAALLLSFAVSASVLATNDQKNDQRPLTCVSRPEICVTTLDELSVPALRRRQFDSELAIVKPVTYRATQHTFMLTYRSDGMRLYARLDLPKALLTALPKDPSQALLKSKTSTHHLPVVVLAPGWISRQEATDWDFGLTGESTSATLINALVAEGFAVITAGYRGRGNVNGQRADGMAFRDAWGNGSYVSPIFYALDVLHLIEALPSLTNLDWGRWLTTLHSTPNFNLNNVSLWGHSQGGDVVLTALAVLGDNPNVSQDIHAASIWSGNIPSRFTQADTFGAMANSTQAFLAGDGTWTGSAQGKNGVTNPDFVFPWPAPVIPTLNTRAKNWDDLVARWSTPTVAKARENKYREMYAALNRYVGDLSSADFEITQDDQGKTRVIHDATVARVMPALGGFNFAKHIAAPLALHISDRDYYSLPSWNTDLAKRINAAGGNARVFFYPGNTHSLTVSKHRWFSPRGSTAGALQATRRDAALFRAGRFQD